MNMDGGDIGGLDAFRDQRKFEFNRHRFNPLHLCSFSAAPCDIDARQLGQGGPGSTT
jgi:hypothetical protein